MTRSSVAGCLGSCTWLSVSTTECTVSASIALQCIARVSYRSSCGQGAFRDAQAAPLQSEQVEKKSCERLTWTLTPCRSQALLQI